MGKTLSVRWLLACFIGLMLGMIASAIPLLLWRKVALNQGNEIVVDILIILSLVLGSWFFIRHSANVVSATIELLIVILCSSIITASAVLVVDRYNYEPITFAILLNGFPASLLFGLPSFLLVFIYIRFFHEY